MILSRQNQFVKALAELKGKKGRRTRGEYLIEGEKAVSEAVRQRLDISVILAATEFYPKYENSGYAVYEADRSVIDCCSDEKTPQGVVAAVRMPEVLPFSAMTDGVCVLLDGVKDPGNVGAIIRTCAALNIGSVVLNECADVFSPKCVRSSMCGIYHVKFYSFDKERDYDSIKNHRVIVADMDGENVFDLDEPRDFCLVLGSESHGVSEYFKALAYKTVKLPMSEKMESLNVAVAGSLIAYQLLKNPL